MNTYTYREEREKEWEARIRAAWFGVGIMWGVAITGIIWGLWG